MPWMIPGATASLMDLPLDLRFGVITSIALIVLLVQYELAVAAGSRGQKVARNLRIMIAPLLAVFMVIVIRRLQMII